MGSEAEETWSQGLLSSGPTSQDVEGCLFPPLLASQGDLRSSGVWLKIAFDPYSTAKHGCRGWTFFCRKKNPIPDEEHSIIGFLWGEKPLRVKYKPLDALLKTAHEEIRDEVFVEEEDERDVVHRWDNVR
ncbi:UNVERIFIED_CONTAM: hypothetical protein K2H54_011913 [Gekko kuhli]